MLLVGQKEGHSARKNMGRWWRWALLSPDGVAPSRMVCVSASVNLPLHHEVQKFSSGTGSPEWSRKRVVKRLWCGVVNSAVAKDMMWVRTESQILTRRPASADSTVCRQFQFQYLFIWRVHLFYDIQWKRICGIPFIVKSHNNTDDKSKCIF